MRGSVFFNCICLSFLALLAYSSYVFATEAEAPRRIVSINMCTDGLLLALADPAQIASLSYLSHDPGSVGWADAAAAYPSNRGRAEEIIALSPDLVLASSFTTPATLSMLRRLGVPIMQLDIPHNFDEIRSQIREVGQIIHQSGKADAVIKAMDAHLSSRPEASLRALVLQSNSIAAGRNTLADGIARQAGLINIASNEGISGYSRMSLEAIIKHAPDIIIIDADNESSPARASQMLQHPALHALMARGTRIITIPSRLWACAGPQSSEAVVLLKQKVQLSQ